MFEQKTPIRFSPLTGQIWDNDSTLAEDYRDANPDVTVWPCNPWTGVSRAYAELRNDPLGHAIPPPGESLTPALTSVEIGKMQDETHVRYSPFSGVRLVRAAPLAEKHWRQNVHRWYFDPWTGAKRNTADAFNDPHGMDIVPAKPDVSLTTLAAMLNQSNDILSDVHWKPAETKIARPQRYSAALPSLAPDPAPFENVGRDAVNKMADHLSALARQEGGNHYKDLAIQPIEYIHKNGIGFAEGSVIKYVSRWRAKGGVQDLKKARHFLDLLIEMEEKK